VRRALVLLILMGLCSTACAAEPPDPVAHFELVQLLPGLPEHISASVTFISDTSIAVGVCGVYTRNCELALLDWNHGELRPIAVTQNFGPEVLNLHRAPDGILALGVTGSALLYSPDLSSKQLLEPVHGISPSGQIVVHRTKGAWHLWRLGSEGGLIRSSHDKVQTFSDDFVVLGDGNVLRIESIDGEMIASFQMPPESNCDTRVRILGGRRLYLADCRQTRIADFNGKTMVRLSRVKGWWVSRMGFEPASADGNRFLSANFSRKVSFLRHAAEIVVAATTLGMGALDELDNREEIRVVDTRTGSVCFDRWRSFPMGSETPFRNVAAISPSGEFVVTVEGGRLSLYRLPALCAPAQ
jgi:hypothetical protein